MIKLILLIAISYNSCFSHQDIVPLIENTNGFNFKGDYFLINQTLIKANTIIDNTPVSMPLVFIKINRVKEDRMVFFSGDKGASKRRALNFRKKVKI
jgi:hypothetical protein